MQTNHDHSLKELIEKLIKSYKWDEKLDSVDVNASWYKVVGEIFGKHTTNLYVRNHILYVQLDSSIIRSELHMARTKIKNMINKDLGKKVIDEIVLR